MLFVVMDANAKKRRLEDENTQYEMTPCVHTKLNEKDMRNINDGGRQRRIP
jgi:hypothetical protein